MLALSALVPALVWLAAAAEARADDGRRGEAAASSRLVPVWVFLDDELPVRGGRVSVVRTNHDPAHVGERTRLRQRNSTRSERTNAAGVAMLHFERLPERFTVVVRGGHAHQRRLPGTLYAEVTRHGTDTDVIEVNPVTTLAAYARTAGRGMRPARARRKVKRLLGIPSWHDMAHDLRHSDKHFDGDSFLHAAHRRDSVQALNRVLLAELRDADRDMRPFRRPAGRVARARAASPLDWLSLITAPEKLIPKVFGELANFAVGKVEERAKQGALGWLTKLAQDLGLIDAESDQLAEIQGALEAMGKQLTAIQGQVEGLYRQLALAELSQLAHQTDTTLGQIDHAQAQLALLASMSPGEPTAANFAGTINDYIGSRLLDAPEILNRNLAPGIPLADNVFKATSRAIAAGTRVFDSRKQAQVKSVYNYFASYQAQLAILLTNYWHSKPDTYSQPTIEQSLARIQSNVTGQASSLKPPLPDGSWVDPSTGLMWTFTDTPVDALRMTTIISNTFAPPGGRPFTDWRLASGDQLSRHLGQVSGSARDYLNAQLGYTDAVVRNTWTSDSVEFWDYRRDPTYPLATRMIRVSIFDLNTKQLVKYTEPGYQYSYRQPSDSWPFDQLFTTNGVAWAQAKVARGLFYVRRPAAGEEYWWGAARAGG